MTLKNFLNINLLIFFFFRNAIISIIAILSAENIFVTPQTKLDEAKVARKKFISPHGDHLTMYNVWKCYKTQLANNTNMNVSKIY